LGIAALIIWFSQSAATQLSRHTFQIVVLASFIPALLAVLVLAVFTREVSAKVGAKTPLFSLKGLDNRFKAFLLAAILFTLGNSSDSFIILRGQERGLSVFQVLLMLMTFNLVYTLLAGPFGALSDRIGRRKLIIAGWLAYSLVYLGFALSKTGWGIWVLFGFYGIYYAMTEGVAKAFVADLVPAERRGTAYGLYNAAIALTAFPASLIAGLLWQGIGSWSGFGPSAPFIFGAVLALGAVGVFALLGKRAA
jgi:MFS family permease